MESCICGKLCTSKAGFILHQRVCEKVKIARSKGQATKQKLNLIYEYEMTYIKDVQDVVELIRISALDAHLAITQHNKSAGRRARKALLKISQQIIPLRKKILTSIK